MYMYVTEPLGGLIPKQYTCIHKQIVHTRFWKFSLCATMYIHTYIYIYIYIYICRAGTPLF